MVAAQKGTPIRVRDIGQVGIGHAIRLGVLGRDHEDDLVQGIVLMRKGENPGDVIAGVRNKVIEIRKLLPPGVELRPYYSSRSTRPDNGDNGDEELSSEGAVLVILLLLALSLQHSARHLLLPLPSALPAVRIHLYGSARHSRQSALTRRHRLRHYRRWRCHHDREYPPPSERTETGGCKGLPRGGALRKRSRQATDIRGPHYHDGVPCRLLTFQRIEGKLFQTDGGNHLSRCHRLSRY